jgi:hypothetical protein
MKYGCQNNGRCVKETSFTARCHCPVGWGGNFCEQGLWLLSCCPITERLYIKVIPLSYNTGILNNCIFPFLGYMHFTSMLLLNTDIDISFNFERIHTHH